MNTVFVPYIVPYPVEQPTVVYLTQPPANQPPVVIESPVLPGQGPSVWGGSQPPATSNNVTVISPSSPEKTEPEKLTLLVFKDHSIYAVTDYCVEDGRLNYVTSYGSKNAVGIDQLDLDFTLKLNEERSVKFELKRKPGA